jgi:hypothetical protein
MSILSLNTLEINGYKATTSNKLKFYKGDRLKLSFSIANSIISEIDSEQVIDGILPITENIQALMIIKDKKVVGTIIEDNKIVFDFKPEYQEIGINQFQLVIIEINDNGEKEILHTPPFKIEVAEPIGNYEDTEIDIEEVARVGYAVVGKSRVAKEVDLYAEIDARYNMTVWETGDLITAAKLNNIEQALLEHAQKLDELLYKAITITSFNISKTLAEIGELVSNLKLTWSYSKEPTVQKLDGNILDNSIRDHIITSNITSNKTFKLEVSDGKTTVSKTTSINFYNGRYYGVSNSETYDSDFILSLNKTLTNSRACSFTVGCGQGQYIFFAIPTRFGTPTFVVGGFEGGFSLISTMDFTNSSNYTEPYYLYKSENHSLGNTTVNVG